MRFWPAERELKLRMQNGDRDAAGGRRKRGIPGFRSPSLCFVPLSEAQVRQDRASLRPLYQVRP